MRKIVLFSAISIDGYIAKKDGNIDWLYEFDAKTKERQDEANKAFFEFYDTIDTTFIGNNTYKHMINNGDKAPFSDKNNFVFTKFKKEKSENAIFVNENILELIANQKNQNNKKNIWLVGGGILSSFFLENKLIDEIILDVIPIVLGNGIRIFENCSNISPVEFQCYKIKKFPSGAVQQYFSQNY